MTGNPVAQAFCMELLDEIERAGLNRNSLSEALIALREEEDTIRERRGHSRSAIYTMFSGSVRSVPDLDLVHDILKVLLQRSQASESARKDFLALWRRKHAKAVRLESKQGSVTSLRRSEPGSESDAATDHEGARTVLLPDTTAKAPDAATPVDLLLIDDVLVDRRADRVILDIRLRNPGTNVVNVTRATVRILKRRKFLAAYHPTADYELLIEGDTNQTVVAHYIKPDDVDRFTVTLGFASPQQGILFTAEVVLHFNGGNTAVSKPITFDSCFD